MHVISLRAVSDFAYLPGPGMLLLDFLWRSIYDSRLVFENWNTLPFLPWMLSNALSFS